MGQRLTNGKQATSGRKHAQALKVLIGRQPAYEQESRQNTEDRRCQQQMAACKGQKAEGKGQRIGGRGQGLANRGQPLEGREQRV